MNVLIIEDELPARAKLETMLKKLDPSIRVIAKLGSVKDSLRWLAENAKPDLALVDIQLSDDHSFEIFRQHHVQFPLIFTTAYDKFLLESFEFNSIDYLLKPVTEEKLKRALEKVKNLEQHFVQGNLQKLLSVIDSDKNRKRLIAKKGSEYISIEWVDVAYIFSEHKICFLKDKAGNQFILDKNLSELEQEMNSSQFFRLNRKFIAHIKAIEKFKSDNGKIRIFLNPQVKEEVFVSKEQASEFRKWMEG